jgi:hypothetical protein
MLNGSRFIARFGAAVLLTLIQDLPNLLVERLQLEWLLQEGPFGIHDAMVHHRVGRVAALEKHFQAWVTDSEAICQLMTKSVINSSIFSRLASARRNASSPLEASSTR